MIQFRVLNNFSDMEKGFGAIEAGISPLIDFIRLGVAEEVKRTYVELLKEHTPEGKFNRDPENNLRSRTSGEVTSDGKDALITFRQSATSQPNQDGSGGGFFYVQSVVKGRVGFDINTNGPFSTGKKAFTTPWGLRTRIGPGRADPYPQEAMAEALPGIATAIREVGAVGLKQSIMVLGNPA